MKRILIAFTVVFFSGMLELTLTARSIHNASLPHVSVRRVTMSEFPFEYIDESGNTQTGTAQKPAVTVEQYENGVYILYRAEVNGELRDFIRRAEMIPGQEYGGFVEVVSGLTFSDRIVVDSDRELCEGEVMVL